MQDPQPLLTTIELQKQLGDAYINEEFIFCQQNGKRSCPRSFSRSFNQLLRKRQLRKIRFHDLRHTHATLLLAKGISVHVVSARLGHASIRITLDHYSHARDAGTGCRTARRNFITPFKALSAKTLPRAPFSLSSNCRQKANKKDLAMSEALNLLVGLTEFESVTSSMSTKHSNQLSYNPIIYLRYMCYSSIFFTIL